MGFSRGVQKGKKGEVKGVMIMGVYMYRGFNKKFLKRNTVPMWATFTTNFDNCSGILNS